MNLSWHNTDQVRVSSRLTYFYKSNCPLLKFSFPDFWINLYQHNTDWVSLGPLSSAFVGVMPLKNMLGPVGDLYCFSNTFRMLVHIIIALTLTAITFVWLISSLQFLYMLMTKGISYSFKFNLLWETWANIYICCCIWKGFLKVQLLETW